MLKVHRERCENKYNKWLVEEGGEFIKVRVSCALLEGALAVSCVSNKRVHGI